MSTMEKRTSFQCRVKEPLVNKSKKKAKQLSEEKNRRKVKMLESGTTTKRLEKK